MSIAEKLQTIAENEQRVYEAGKKAEYDAFWDKYQENGNRTDLQCAFAGAGWNAETFNPKYDMKPTNAYMMFRYTLIYDDFVENLEKKGITLDFSECTNMQYAFYGAVFSRIGVVDLRKSSNNGYLFGYAGLLKIIDKVIVTESTTLPSTAFNGAKFLEEIRIEGIIGQSGFDFRGCANLSKASITSIINALSTTTSGLTVTLSKTAKEAAFTADEWSALIATRTNWTISLV